MHIDDVLCQTGVVLLGGAATWLVAQRRVSIRRWGFLAGVASQPFYFYTFIKYHQWGMLLTSGWYLYSFLVGTYQHWWLKSDQVKMLDEADQIVTKP